MEAAAFIETVSALATAAFTVAKTIAKIVEDLKEAKGQIAAIGIDTKAVGFVLRQLSERLKEFVAPLERDDPTYIQVKSLTEDVRSVCEKEIEGIERIIKPLMPSNRAKSMPFKRKWKWLLAKSGVASRVASLANAKLTLNLMLIALDIRSSSRPRKSVMDHFEQLKEMAKDMKTMLVLAEEDDEEARKDFAVNTSLGDDRYDIPESKSLGDDNTTTMSRDEHLAESAKTGLLESREPESSPIEYERDRQARPGVDHQVESDSESSVDIASLTPYRGETHSERSTNKEHDDREEDEKMSSVTAWYPGEHWQSKINESLRVQQEVIDFGSRALIRYGSGLSYPPQAYHPYSQPPPRRMQEHDPEPAHAHESNSPQPPTPPTENAWDQSRSITDPEFLRMKKELEMLRMERKKADEAQARAELVQIIRQEEESKMTDRMNAMREAQEKAKKEVELAKAACEQAAFDRFEEDRKGENERRQMERDLRDLVAREERERIEAEYELKAQQEKEQSAALKKANRDAEEKYKVEREEMAFEKMLEERRQVAEEMERKADLAKAAEVASEAALAATELKFEVREMRRTEEEARQRERDISTKWKEFQELTSELARMQGLHEAEAAVWKDKMAWLKEKYDLKEEAFRARINALTEVRGDYGMWLALRPSGNAANARPSPRTRTTSESSSYLTESNTLPHTAREIAEDQGGPRIFDD